MLTHGANKLKVESRNGSGQGHRRHQNLQIRSPAGRRHGAARGSLAVAAKLVLVPVGDGSTNHLEESVPLPGELELKDGVFEVGREAPADIVIPVPTVSGRHALLRVKGSSLQVTDLGSTNGTYVGDDELATNQAVMVPLGTTIVFGDASLAAFEVIDRPEGNSSGSNSGVSTREEQVV